MPTMGADLMRVVKMYCMKYPFFLQPPSPKSLVNQTFNPDDNTFENIGNATSYVWYGTRVSC